MSNAQRSLPLEQDQYSEQVADTSSSNELQQIQEILFGRQQRTHSQHIEAVRERCEERIVALTKDVSELHQQTLERLDALESQFSAQLEKQNKTLQSAIDGAHSTITDSDKRLSDQLAQQQQAARLAHTELSEKLNSSAAENDQALQTTRKELTEKFETALHDLQAGKLDRQALAAMMSKMANQLTEPS